MTYQMLYKMYILARVTPSFCNSIIPLIGVWVVRSPRIVIETDILQVGDPSIGRDHCLVIMLISVMMKKLFRCIWHKLQIFEAGLCVYLHSSTLKATLYHTMGPILIKFKGNTGQKIADFDPKWAFPGCNLSLNLLLAMKWCRKLEAT